MTREEWLAKYQQKIEEVYRKRTPKSWQIIEQRAMKYVPDGDYREAVWFEPNPAVMTGGDGCYLHDVDGHTYIDFHNCWTAMIWGNSPASIVQAIREQALKGSAMGAPTESVSEWAGIICGRVPSVERVRFCCSGTEAVMFAIRGARTYTGRDKILKMIGNYHGSYDPMEPVVGWRRLPPGVAKSSEQDVLVTPFNDKEAAEKIIRENKDQLAAVIVEGVMGAGGLIPPKDGFLNFLRKVTNENNVLLIMDEVISFRLSTGGAQQIYNVKPDLTTFGKTIGGGLPVGAFGGSADVMAVFSPKQKRPAHHSGTLLATPIGAAAGIVGLKEMTQEALDRINVLGDMLTDRLQRTLATLKIKAQITGYGSLRQIHFTPEPVTHAEVSLIKQDRDLLRLFHLAMLNRDIFIPRRGMYNISMPMTEAEINRAVDATADALSELKPLIREIAPQLIG
jgi:glutamate-1-semialdehyde 2,1-aminomutase